MFWRLWLIQAFAVLVAVGITAAFVLPDAPAERVVMLALAAAAMAALPAWIVNHYYSQPLRELAAQADALAAGDLGRKVYVGSSGEVRALAQAGNAMSERLAERFARLAADRGRLRGILDGLVEGVVALDPSDEIVFANERAGQLLDVAPDRAKGRKLWEVVRHRPLLQLIESAARSREPQRSELDWKGPPSRSLAVYAAPLAGNAGGLIVVVHDLSDLRRLEGLRQEFVANVSHELKTPLTAIMTSVESLLDGAGEDAEPREMFLKQIAEQSDRLHALILDLLSLARIESSGQQLTLTEVAIESLVADCLKRYRVRAEASGLTLSATPAGDAIAALADEEALDTILSNLVDNAIKYTATGGTVDVRWGRHESSVWFEVTDSGVGIPEADLPRVFERFYRVDKARARELGGTGLGLSIVKHLAQSMNGTVTAQSTVGQGSTFRVSLPAA